jgi:amino-acid N-acetyltransferase
LTSIDVLDRARAAGHQGVYLLTDSAERYFARHGFRRLERAQAPLEVRESEQFRSQTCASAAVMMIELRPRETQRGVGQ